MPYVATRLVSCDMGATTKMFRLGEQLDGVDESQLDSMRRMGLARWVDPPAKPKPTRKRKKPTSDSEE